MAQFRDDLGTLIGEVRNLRPNVGPEQVKRWINWRIRQALDARPYWVDLIREGLLVIPEPWERGTISVTHGSTRVIGTDTNWPVSDVVNTTLAEPVDGIGFCEAVPQSMSGISEDSLLLIGGQGVDPEVVPVVQVNADRFIGRFERAHPTGSYVRSSSLAGLQLRTSSDQPIYTVKAVHSATEMELNLPWGGPSADGLGYCIRKIYVTLAPDLKAILAMKDDQTGLPVRLHVPLEEIDYRDPRRVAKGTMTAYCLVDLGPNERGNMQYEIWPPPSSARQFSYRYYQQWPDLERDTDRPPWFINPSIFVYGALADAFRFRQGPKDPYYNPGLADHYEARFREGLEQAKQADEAKFLAALRTPWWRTVMPGTYDHWQLNDPRILAWDFGWDGIIF